MHDIESRKFDFNVIHPLPLCIFLDNNITGDLSDVDVQCMDVFTLNSNKSDFLGFSITTYNH